VITKTGSKSKL